MYLVTTYIVQSNDTKGTVAWIIVTLDEWDG